MSYTMYSARELRDLAKQCEQRLGESVPAWLLRLWDDSVDDTELSPTEMGQLASIATVPSLQTNPQASNQTPISGLRAAVRGGECWRSPQLRGSRPPAWT